jgi:hypothetical protein
LKLEKLTIVNGRLEVIQNESLGREMDEQENEKSLMISFPPLYSTSFYFEKNFFMIKEFDDFIP